MRSSNPRIEIDLQAPRNEQALLKQAAALKDMSCIIFKKIDGSTSYSVDVYVYELKEILNINIMLLFHSMGEKVMKALFNALLKPTSNVGLAFQNLIAIKIEKIKQAKQEKTPRTPFSSTSTQGPSVTEGATSGSSIDSNTSLTAKAEDPIPLEGQVIETDCIGAVPKRLFNDDIFLLLNQRNYLSAKRALKIIAKENETEFSIVSGNVFTYIDQLLNVGLFNESVAVLKILGQAYLNKKLFVTHLFEQIDALFIERDFSKAWAYLECVTKAVSFDKSARGCIFLGKDINFTSRHFKYYLNAFIASFAEDLAALFLEKLSKIPGYQKKYSEIQVEVNLNIQRAKAQKIARSVLGEKQVILIQVSLLKAGLEGLVLNKKHQIFLPELMTILNKIGSSVLHVHQIADLDFRKLRADIDPMLSDVKAKLMQPSEESTPKSSDGSARSVRSSSFFDNLQNFKDRVEEVLMSQRESMKEEDSKKGELIEKIDSVTNLLDSMAKIQYSKR